jgi:hypothetical protein
MLGLAALLTSMLAWLLVQATAAAHAVRHGATLAAAWLAHQSQVLGAILWRWLTTMWSWTRIQSARLARVSVKGASIAAAWSTAQSRSLAHWLRRETGELASLTRKKAGHFSRTSLATASLGFSWSPDTKQCAADNHRALVPRRCTALISFEPRRSSLPTMHAG